MLIRRFTSCMLLLHDDRQNVTAGRTLRKDWLLKMKKKISYILNLSDVCFDIIDKIKTSRKNRKRKTNCFDLI